MEQFDIVIIGSGSGNSIPSPAFDDRRIALVERDVFGGTCLNRGCIPSKMFVYAADVAEAVKRAGKYGVHATFDGMDWISIRDRVFGRIDPIAAGGEDYRINGCPNITVFQGSGRFVDHKVLEVNGEQITAETFILGAGARPFVPDVAGIDTIVHHTSDTLMRVDEFPKRLIVVGGGYIAAEMGHVFGGLGSEVTFILRSDQMLRNEDDEIAARATELYGKRFDIKTMTEDLAVEPTGVGDGVRLSGTQAGEPFTVEADAILFATGRVPNGDDLGVAATGVELDGRRVVTDDNMATNVPGIWAFGDITNELQLKHLANLEAKIVFHNIDHPDDLQSIDRTLVPHAVFGEPQVASVGLTERAAKAAGIPHVVTTKDYGSTAYGWAMEDDSSFVKLVAHAETRKLLGAHLIGPNASILIQQLIQGMRFGQTVEEMGQDVWYIHPALSEVVENALLDFA